MGSSSFSAYLLKALLEILTSDSTQKMLDTGDADKLRIILNDLKLPKDPNNTDFLSLATVPPHIFNTTLMDVFLPIAEGVFNEDMTDLNPEFIKSIGEKTHDKLLAMAKGEELVNTLFSAFVAVYTKRIMDQYQDVYPKPMRPPEIDDDPSQESDDKLDEYLAKNSTWSRNKNNFKKDLIDKITQSNVSKKFLSSSAPPFRLEHELIGLNHLRNITNQCNDLLNQAAQIQEKKDKPAQQTLNLRLKSIGNELQQEIDALNQDKTSGKESKLGEFITKLEKLAATLKDKTQPDAEVATPLAQNLMGALNTIKLLKSLNDLSALTEDSSKQLSNLKTRCKSKSTVKAVAKVEHDLIDLNKEIHQCCNAWKEPLKITHSMTKPSTQQDLLGAVQKIHHKLADIGENLKKIEEKPIQQFAERFLNRLFLIISFGYRGYAGSEKNRINEKVRAASVNHSIQKHCATIKRELGKIRTAQSPQAEEASPDKPSSPPAH